VAGVTFALSNAQTPLTTKLAPEVREYVKFDDAVIALSHIGVIDGTGQPAREDQTFELGVRRNKSDKI